MRKMFGASTSTFFCTIEFDEAQQVAYRHHLSLVKVMSADSFMYFSLSFFFSFDIKSSQNTCQLAAKKSYIPPFKRDNHIHF